MKSNKYWVLALTVSIFLGAAVSAWADVPGDWQIDWATGNPTMLAPRPGPTGTVPNPGTQQQELTNVTADMGPAFYNVFEFPVTCMACHGGVIAQQAGHSGNWAGSSMGSAARDPVHRAVQIIVEKAVEGLTGKGGAGNMCFRCHSPNGWYSGRFDPTLGGSPDGSGMFHTILASTDDEGILCEFCHRTIGNVTMKRADLDPNDPVWNMLNNFDVWPHDGNPYPAGPLAGDPYGDTTLQINDGMTYGASFRGVVTVHYSDTPLPGTLYTGQTYGIYPPNYVDQWGTPRGGETAVNPDGTTPVHFEYPARPPKDLYLQALSPEHSTFQNNFLRSPEFCGSCHDLTVPVLNHGMPEQRTFTEWKYSDFGRSKASPTYKRCQDCHMPRMLHEYDDITPVSINCDPTVSGWFPMAKSRNAVDPVSGQAGTPFHKFAGANFNLPDMLKILYPEVDLEVIGEPTLDDPRLFPGMQSDRKTMWERTKQNTLVNLRDGVSVEIVPGSLVQVQGDIWQVQAKVTNNAGHKIPSGYPDGRRFWIRLDVKDAGGVRVYNSGHYKPASLYSSNGFDYAQANSATLYNDTWMTTGLNRALSKNIGSVGAPVKLGGYNEVMIYERRTGNIDAQENCTITPSLLNFNIVFDNRIPPAGWKRLRYEAAGSKFWTYDRVTTGLDETNNATGINVRADSARYAAGVNYDIVTYTFQVPKGRVPTQARAEVHWQIHPRFFMEFVRDNDNSTLRPEGPPILWTANYPLEPNYLSQDYYFGGVPFRKTLLRFTQVAADPFAVTPGNPGTLRDNWGGVAFAAWFRSGLGEPFRVTAADTAATAPAAPSNLRVAATPNAYTVRINWDPAAGAEGYVVWMRYGKNDATAAWDRVAVLNGPKNTRYLAEALNPGKTYGFKVQAFNGGGTSPDSLVLDAQAAALGVPAAPDTLTVLAVGGTWIQLQFTNNADNESGFIIQRQAVDAGGPVGPFQDRAKIGPSGVAGAEVRWTDSGLAPGQTFNYRVAAYIAPNTRSTYSVPVQGQTLP
jgi:hypothetical protein